MPKPKKPDAERLARTVGVRLTADDVARLDALLARVPISSRNSIARAALLLGLAELEADPTRLISGPVKPKAKRR
jgi:hypothetical protein